MKEKSKIYLILFFVLIVASFMRFNNFIDRGGICETDEASILQESEFLYTGLGALFKYLPELIKEAPFVNFEEFIEKIKRETVGMHLRHPRPTHDSLIAFLGIFTGGIKDYTGNILSAITSILCIIFIFLLTQSIYNTRIALFASSLLSVSGYFLLYSRETITEVSTTFFFVLAIYLYHKSRIKKEYQFTNLCLGSFLVGLSYTSHYRYFLMPVIFWIVELQLLFFSKDFKILEKIKRFLYLNIFMVLPLLLWEVPFYLAMLLLKQVDRPLYFQTYIELLFDNIMRFGSNINFSLNDILAYPYYLWRLESPLLLVFLIIGLFKIIKKYKSEDLLIILPFVLPFLFFSIFSADFPRFLVISIPFISIIAAKALDFNLKLFKKMELSTILIILALIWGISNSYHITNLRSGMREVFNYLKENGIKKHLTTHYEMSVFYIKDKESIKDIREDVKDYQHLRSLYNQGYRYLISDIQKYINRFPHWPFEPPEILKDIEKKCNPVYVAKDNRGLYLRHWFGHCVVSFEDCLNFYQNLPLEEKLGIKIYDLKEYFKEG